MSFLFYRNKKASFVSLTAYRLAFGFRFLSLSLMAILLLGIFIHWVKTKEEKPVLLIAVDQSNSILACPDSVMYQKLFPEKLKEFISNASSKFQVDLRGFDAQIRDSFQVNYPGRKTDFSKIFQYASDQYYKNNLGAIIVASDGIINNGENPLYTSDELKIPVYTMCMGDTSIQRDLAILNCRSNAFAMEGNSFEVQLEISGSECLAKNIELHILCDGKEIQQQKIPVISPNFKKNISLILPAGKEGSRHFSIQLSPITNEYNRRNNQWDFILDVSKSKEQILILALAPHPDISALKQLLESSGNAQINVQYIQNFTSKELAKYDRIILHQVPGPRSEGVNVIQQIQKEGIPSLFILGEESGINPLSTMNLPISITGNRGQFNQAEAVYNSDFSLFAMESNWVNELQSFPPLTSPYGKYNISSTAEVLCYQKINGVNTQFPLLFFTRDAFHNNYQGYLCGEGIWKWRLNEFSRNGNHTMLEQWLNRIMQLISRKNDKNRLRINPVQRIFSDNESVAFDAEVYNANYETVQNASVKMNILLNNGKKIQTQFPVDGNNYHLDVGSLPVGTYNYFATCDLGNDHLQKTGKIIVSAMQLERMNTQANHAILRQLSNQTQAISVPVNRWDEIWNHIKQKNTFQVILYEDESNIPLQNFSWILFLIVALLTAEWLIRKWSGLI